jgi:hypothetical protein
MRLLLQVSGLIAIPLAISQRNQGTSGAVRRTTPQLDAEPARCSAVQTSADRPRHGRGHWFNPSTAHQVKRGFDPWFSGVSRPTGSRARRLLSGRCGAGVVWFLVRIEAADRLVHGVRDGGPVPGEQVAVDVLGRLDCPASSRRVQSAYGVAARSAFRRHWTRRLLARDSAPARRTGTIDHTADVAVSTPAADRDLVAEASRTVGRADEIDLRQRGRPFLLCLPESADAGNP